MRYYDTGDKIYIFGFSRGAFTARFLARMVATVGLLSKGNEEMVPFVYGLYQRYEQGAVKVDDQGHIQPYPSTKPSENSPKVAATKDQLTTTVIGYQEPAQTINDELTAFRNTFCRRERDPKNQTGFKGIKVHFLGLFDCVSSVSTLEAPFGRSSPPITVLGTATHVRHAVAIDERRVKFRAALLAQDIPHAKAEHEDIKEVWYAPRNTFTDLELLKY